MLPHDGAPFDVPIWREVTVHLDYDISFQSALHSALFDRCPPGGRIEVRGDRQLVQLYHHGVLIAVHVRQPKGHAIDGSGPCATRTHRNSAAPSASFSRRVSRTQPSAPSRSNWWPGVQPWAKLRQAQKVLRLARRYGIPRAEQACAYALRPSWSTCAARTTPWMNRRALRSTEARVDQMPPSSRFARPGSAFENR
jgi:hypothetical protein